MLSLKNIGSAMVGLLSLLFLFMFYTTSLGEYDLTDPEAVIFRNGNGYGYTINVNGRVAVRQPSVPSYDPSIVFCDSMEAVRISRLVISRIRNEEQVPLSRSEIKKYDVALCEK